MKQKLINRFNFVVHLLMESNSKSHNNVLGNNITFIIDIVKNIQMKFGRGS